jgi:hypothetical protein
VRKPDKAWDNDAGTREWTGSGNLAGVESPILPRQCKYECPHSASPQLLLLLPVMMMLNLLLLGLFL